MASERTEAAGTTFSFRSISGEVIGTDQRSDSYTTGTSRTVIYDGSGGGSGHVTTEVVVNRDIWFRDGDAREHHVRVASDVPVRIGQRIAVVHLKAERPSTAKTFDGVVSVYVLSTDRYWTTTPLVAVNRRLVEPDKTSLRARGYALACALSVPLCFAFVGFPMILALFVWGKVQAFRRGELATEIAKAMEASLIEARRLAYCAFEADQKRLAELTAAEKPRAIGAAS